MSKGCVPFLVANFPSWTKKITSNGQKCSHHQRWWYERLPPSLPPSKADVENLLITVCLICGCFSPTLRQNPEVAHQKSLQAYILRGMRPIFFHAGFEPRMVLKEHSLTALGFEPTPFWNGALSHHLSQLGQSGESFLNMFGPKHLRTRS